MDEWRMHVDQLDITFQPPRHVFAAITGDTAWMLEHADASLADRSLVELKFERQCPTKP